jgi:hypothetical protein
MRLSPFAEKMGKQVTRFFLLTAHGRDGQCPQEGPQLVAAQLPQPAPPAAVFPTLPAKADIRRFARFEPHFGQTTSTFSSRLRKNTSKLSLHLPHLNSKIGMGSIPPAEPGILKRHGCG